MTGVQTCALPISFRFDGSSSSGPILRDSTYVPPEVQIDAKEQMMLMEINNKVNQETAAKNSRTPPPPPMPPTPFRKELENALNPQQPGVPGTP